MIINELRISIYFYDLFRPDSTINCTTNFSTANTKNLFFGRYTNTNPWYHLNGALDKIKIYNKALTSAEVTGLYTPATTYTIATSSNPTVGGTTSGGGTFSCGQNVSLIRLYEVKDFGKVCALE